MRSKRLGYLVKTARGVTIELIGNTDRVSESTVRVDASSPELAFKIVRSLIPEGPTVPEHFVVLYLNTLRQLLEARVISIGTISATLVHPREVFSPVLSLGASSIVVAHNHPSGNLDPSAEDTALTRRLRQAGDILGIELADHLIVSESSYYSFKEMGRL